MSDNLERIPLEEDQEELISGGRLRYLSCVAKGYWGWSSENPDVRYQFKYENFAALRIIEKSNPKASDEQLLAMMKAEGLIF